MLKHSLIFLLLACGGCTLAIALEGQSQKTWVREQGGVLTGAHQARAEVALARVCEGLIHTPLHIHVLSPDHAGAYAWRTGDVYVTRGLVDLLDDDELAAAVAHELAHLAEGGRLHTIAALQGDVPTGDDAEMRADVLARRILRKQGIREQSLVRVLDKLLDDPSVSPFARRLLQQRIARLSS